MPLIYNIIGEVSHYGLSKIIFMNLHILTNKDDKVSDRLQILELNFGGLWIF